MEKILTCQEFLGILQLDDTWESPISLKEFIDSPECGECHIVKELIVFVTKDGDEYTISDPDNVNQRYPVSIEL